MEDFGQNSRDQGELNVQVLLVRAERNREHHLSRSLRPKEDV